MFAGVSNKTGFKIIVYRKINKLKFSEPSLLYQQTSNKTSLKDIILITLLVLLTIPTGRLLIHAQVQLNSFFDTPQMLYPKQNVFVWISAYLLLLFIFDIVSRIRKTYKSKETVRKQWHSVEHKICRLFEKQKEINLYNIKNTDDYSWWCGEVIFVTMSLGGIFVLFSLGLITFIKNIFIKLGLNNSFSMFVGCLLLAILMLGISLLVSYFYEKSTLSKPTDAQYEEGLRVAKRIEEKLKEMNDESK